MPMQDFYELEERTRQMLASSPFAVNHGLRLDFARPDHLRLTATVTPEMHNPYRMVHGGEFLIMADTAAGICAHTDGGTYLTESCDFHFIGNIGSGDFFAEAKVVHRGKTVVLVHVDVTADTGKLLCDGTFTMFAVKAPRPL